ncbi:hypothetical protein K474DRAFT_1285091 [Panus rudis PR-1116 ss-1]|nr:hypothetical protein K474DRAFT_1285091 [Panus rudis PR-1116 ss-1]
MHLTFNPSLCQETTVPLPENAAHYDLQFKATFDSNASYEQAKRDGTRVEMWTDLPAIGGTDEVGGWRALAFAFPESLHQAESDKEEVSLSCVPSQQYQVDAGESEKSVYLHARLDSAAVQGTPTFSFTYRLVYRDGGVQWLGAYGQNGVLRIERRDARISADESRAELKGDLFKAKGQVGENVGALNPAFNWESVAFDKNG